MHKAGAYILPVLNAIGDIHLPYPWEWHWREGGWGVGGRGWGGSVEQTVQERGRSEGCFVFTSWLVGTFDNLTNFVFLRAHELRKRKKDCSLYYSF